MRVSEVLSNTSNLISNHDKDTKVSSFATTLREALAQVNRLQIEADEEAAKLALGTATDLHRVMIAGERAQLALQLTIAVRNRVVEAYQELSRMQI